MTLITTQEPGSLFLCHEVISLQFTHIRSSTYRSRLRNLRAHCSTVGLCLVTITWKEILKSSLKAGVSKLRPAGHIRAAKPFYPTREAILSMTKKIMLKKQTAKCVYEKFVDLVEYNIFRNNHIT